MKSTAAERETIWRLRHKHKIAPKKISELFPHLKRDSVRRIASTWNPANKEELIPPKGKTTVEHTDKEIIIDSSSSDISRIKTLEDLIHRANIDTDKWKIDRWIANTWENAMKGEDGEPILTTLYQVKAYLKPNELAEIKLFIESLRDEIREGSTIYKPTQVQYCNGQGRNMLEISIPDMHFGMLALKEETSEEYNLDIAEQTYRTAVSSLLSTAQKGSPIHQIVLPIGNDLLHIDNSARKTFAGTEMDSVHSLKQLFRRVKNILRDSILDMAEIAPVHVIAVPGNHDPTTSYFLAEALEDSFYNHPSVTFDNGGKSRKFYEWGIVLLGFTHGDKEKHDRLPGLMSNEMAEAWARTQWREWHIGHKHRKATEHYLPATTHNGVIVRTLPSLTAADAWHYRHGFIGGVRSAEAYLWNEQTALVNTYNVNLIKAKK
jgi:hypothetical protein